MHATRSSALWLALSLALHASVLLFAGLQFTNTQQHTNPGTSDHNAIQSYVYQAPQPRKVLASNRKGIALKKKRRKKQKQIKQHAQSSAASKGEKTKGLLALLHNAIQAQQNYPDSAQDMGREGRPSVSFTLYPDGHITHPHITHSSGTASLDKAALQAVNAAAPFTKARQYIHRPGEYSIDVLFELT